MIRPGNQPKKVHTGQFGRPFYSFKNPSAAGRPRPSFFLLALVVTNFGVHLGPFLVGMALDMIEVRGLDLVPLGTLFLTLFVQMEWWDAVLLV